MTKIGKVENIVDYPNKSFMLEYCNNTVGGQPCNAGR